MRFYMFFSGLTIIAMGAVAVMMLERAASFGFLQGSLTLGGGIIICGLFSLKVYWHGLIGAGILALLAAARGLANIPGLIKFIAGDRPNGSAPMLEFGVTLIAILLLMKIIRALSQERQRRLRESEE